MLTSSVCQTTDFCRHILSKFNFRIFLYFPNTYLKFLPSTLELETKNLIFILVILSTKYRTKKPYTRQKLGTRDVLSSLILGTCWTTFVFISMLKSVNLSGCLVVWLSGCQVVRLSGCHIVKFDPSDMLNNFCFHVYAQKSMFKVENDNGSF